MRLKNVSSNGEDARKGKYVLMFGRFYANKSFCISNQTWIVGFAIFSDAEGIESMRNLCFMDQNNEIQKLHKKFHFIVSNLPG